MSDFYTLKGYQLKSNNDITNAVEDYIEMIYRLSKRSEYISIKKIAENLNVQPPSVSKMANRLKKLELIEFEKYSQIKLTTKGKELGKYLLYRHNVLKKFFKQLNKDKFTLEQVEKIEHFIDQITVKNIEKGLNSPK